MPTPKQGQAAQNVVPGIADPGSLGVPEDEQLGQGEQLTITGSADQIAKLTGRPEVKQVEAQQAPQAAPEQPEVAPPTEQAATGESFRQGFVDAPQDSPLPQAQSGGVQQGDLDKVAVALAAEAAGGPLAGAAAIQTLQGLEDPQPVGGPLGIATNAALGAIEQESIRQDEQQQAQEQAQQQADDLEEDNQGSVDAAISATDQSFKRQQDNLQELQAARDTLGKAARGELTLDSPARRVFAIIGGALGGLLGSLNGTGRNAFLENLNRAIDRDVQASTNQLANLTQTLGSRQAAVKAATLSTLTQLSNDIDRRTAGIKNPAIIERAQSLKSQVEAQRAVVLGQSTALSLDQIKKRQDIELARREQNRKEAETVSQNQRRGVQNATDAGQLVNDNLTTNSKVKLDDARRKKIEAETRKALRGPGPAKARDGRVASFGGTTISFGGAPLAKGSAIPNNIGGKKARETLNGLLNDRENTGALLATFNLFGNPRGTSLSAQKAALEVIANQALAGKIKAQVSDKDLAIIQRAAGADNPAKFFETLSREGVVKRLEAAIGGQTRQINNVLEKDFPGVTSSFKARAIPGLTDEPPAKVTTKTIRDGVTNADPTVDDEEEIDPSQEPDFVVERARKDSDDPENLKIKTSKKSREIRQVFNSLSSDPTPKNVSRLRELQAGTLVELRQLETNNLAGSSEHVALERESNRIERFFSERRAAESDRARRNKESDKEARKNINAAAKQGFRGIGPK